MSQTYIFLLEMLRQLLSIYYPFNCSSNFNGIRYLALVTSDHSAFHLESRKFFFTRRPCVSTLLTDDIRTRRYDKISFCPESLLPVKQDFSRINRVLILIMQKRFVKNTKF